MFNSTRTLTGYPSIFLDGIRFLAAMTVFITHARAISFPAGELDTFPENLSHGAVVIFFVLSGFVIAHTTTASKRGFGEYFAARLSRLYSVFLPAIFITFICQFLVKNFNSEIYNTYHQDKTAFRYLISLAFLNEAWFLTSAPIINGPIWSLSYEFWYYAIFGLFFYSNRLKGGWVWAVLACIIAGPKILLMMVMWLIGWFAYHLPRPAFTIQTRWIITVLMLIISVYVMIYLPSLPHQVNTTKMHWADKYLSDWMASIFVGLAFYFLPNGEKTFRDSKIMIHFRQLADLTFPVYVLHFPLLVLCKSLLLRRTNVTTMFYSSLFLSFFALILIGLFLESKRRWWLMLFKKLIVKSQPVNLIA